MKKASPEKEGPCLMKEIQGLTRFGSSPVYWLPLATFVDGTMPRQMSRLYSGYPERLCMLPMEDGAFDSSRAGQPFPFNLLANDELPSFRDSILCPS